MQLSKRLEQVLMDKEEALDQLDVLRVSPFSHFFTVFILYLIKIVFSVVVCVLQEQLDAIRTGI